MKRSAEELFEVQNLRSSSTSVETETASLAEAVDSINTASSADQIAVQDSQIDVNQQFTQNVTRQLKRRRVLGLMTQAHNSDLSEVDGSPAKAGIILKLELHNFMCHAAFKLEFGEQTNFIIGRNGSGKSAILTGISVALGAKASDTDRGNSLKGLIMHGKNVARASVTFKNEGTEAYRPDEYGKTIIIERVIKADSSPSCQIKDESGRVRSTKKQTIDDILDYYGITIANPMTILTQTEAKTFLAHSSDEGKFRYFMEGTRLQETFNNVQELQKDVNEIKQKLSSDEEIFQQSKEKLDQTLELWNNFKNSDEFKRQQDLLSGKRLWLEVVNKEEQLRLAKNLLDERRAEVDNFDKFVEETENSIRNYQAEKDEKAQKLLDLDETLQNKDIEKESMKEELKKTQESLKQIQLKQASIQNEITADEATLENVESQINLEKNRLDSDTSATFGNLQNLKAKQKEEMAEHRTRVNELTAAAEELKLQKSDLSESYRREANEIKQELSTLEQSKAQFNNKQGSRLDCFGVGVVRLLKELGSSTNRYKGRITGPLGMKFSLKSEYEKWGWVLEILLQRQLGSFLVENFSDSSILRDRMKFYQVHSDITVRKAEVFDYSHSVPRGNHLKMVDALSFSDKTVECVLVDTNRIHTTLLIENRTDAEQVLLNDHENKISAVICLIQGGALRISKRNNRLQTDPITSFKNRGWITLHRTGDSENPASQYDRQLREANERLRAADARWKQADKKIEDELQASKNEIKELRARISVLTKASGKIDMKLEELQSGTGKLESYEEDRERLRGQIQLNVDRIKGYKAESETLKSEYQKVRDKFTAAGHQIKSIQRQKAELSDSIEQLKDQIGESRDSVRMNQMKIGKYKNDVSKLDDFVNMQLPPVIETLATNAGSHCSREEADLQQGDTIEKVDAQIEAIAKTLSKIEQDVGVSRDQAKLNVIKAHDAYNDIKKKYDESVKLHNHLASSLQARLENLTATASLLIQEVNSVFESALRLRGFTGKIDFDFAKARLVLRVSTKPSERLRNVESFSGGEKSFAQIAFLLAIWKPMQSKVRGLDEFDVFMDQVNRRLALKLILQKVGENPKTQTIFITPLQITQVDGLDQSSVHIHEITPPERNIQEN
ncbi:hypothetical protein OGAPHI_006193 [Ogataea philodendri]|uniref:RecF/RecN/SMC N-terminal domain-containing protein n=1 Tax=Ogataea philodendri TaxID=1378263 RepID=A0A9P8NYP9_9ASCO|nr:uncharacterized protein OGAPHI_006193 [Ogataea philodendri]KAH3662012.1 hypothetical protein OGAPHI_006193 [Ogataea philodendri]